MATRPDVQLLVGIKRGESYTCIDEDLAAIQKHIDKKKLRITVTGLKTESAKDLKKELQERLNAVQGLKIVVPKITLGSEAKAELKKEIASLVKEISAGTASPVFNGTKTSESGSGAASASASAKQDGQDALEAARKLAVFNEEMRTLIRLRTQMRSARAKAELGVSEEDRATLHGLISDYNEWIAKIDAVKSRGSFVPGERDELIQRGQNIREQIAALTEHATATEKDTAAIKRADEALKQANANLDKWTRAKTGRSSAQYEQYKNDTEALKGLIAQYRAGEIDTERFNARFGELTASMQDSRSAIEGNGEAAKTLSDRLGGLAKKFASWFTVSQLIMAAYRAMKKMVAAVTEIDTAMTELKKVTDETAATYERFLTNAAGRAKELGTTVSDIVTATADFARLGYNITDAATLADVATVYKNVGDGIENISDASESIISTMKAFGVSANDAMSIVDKFNNVGNNFAISSKGVGDALLRSASAMHAAGNDLDETIALATAANTIIQSPEKVGTTLKTISMFLRSAKTELEDAGESTEGMAESVSKLRGNILALTGNRVDIQKDADTYKSTIDILRELSAVWGDLADVTRANILEMIGGKRNANVTAALLENFQLVEEVLETSRHSAGSAMEENAKYMESIKGHLAQLKASFQELSQTVVDTDSVKFFIDIGKSLIGVLNTVMKLVSAVGGLRNVAIVIAGIFATIKSQTIVNAIRAVGSLPATAMKAATSLKELALAATAADWAFAGITVALTAFFIISNKIKQDQQRRIDAMNDAARAANEERDSLASLISEYKRLAETGINTDDNREQARSIQEQITDLVGEQASNLDLVNGKLDEQIKKLDEISYKNAREARGALYTKKSDAEDQYNRGITANGAHSQFAYVDVGKGSMYAIDYGADIFNALGATNRTSRRGGVQSLIDNPIAVGSGGRTYSIDLNGLDAGEVLTAFRDIQDTLLDDETWKSKVNNVNDILNSVQEQITFYEGLVQERDSARESYFKNEAIIDTFNYLKFHDVDSQEAFDAAIESINKATGYSEEYKRVLIETANEAFPQFDRGAQEAAAAAEREAEAAKEAAEANRLAMMLDDPMGYVQSQFDGVVDAINSVREAMEPLSKLQEEVADGFTMSIDKAMEFAKVYPEILNGAQAAADGQITLNEDVVRSFIAGKEQELGASLDAKIAELEAERETYAGQLALAQAELEYLKQAADGKIQTTREATKFRLMCANAEAKAMIDSGMSAEEAYATAAEHMSDSSYDFSDVVADVAKNIWHNLSESTKSITASNGLIGGIKRAMQTFVGLTKQAHQAAAAVAGVAKGDATKGSEELVQLQGGIYQYTDTATGDVAYLDRRGGKGGTTRDKLEEIRNRQAKELDQIMSDIQEEIGLVEMDISNYEQAISLIDGRIEALRAAKHISLPEGSSKSKSGGSGSSGGSSGGSSSSSKDEELERLKSIVSLLETELKLLEAQGAPAQDRINKIKEIQSALQDEIDYLRSVGGDQETINNLLLQQLNYQKDIDDIYSKTAQSAKDALDDLAKYRVKMLEDELKKRKDNLNKQLDALKDFYDRQKKLLQDQYDEDKYLEEQAEKRKAVSDIEAQIEQLRYDDSAWAQKRRLELEEELAKARKDLDDFEKEHALETTKDELDKMYEMQLEELEKERDAVDDALADEVGLYDKAMEDIKNGSIDLYNELAAWVKENGDPVADSIKEAWDAAYKALKDYRDLYGQDYNGVKLDDATGNGAGGGSSGGKAGGSSGSGSGGGSSGGAGGSSGSSGGSSGGKSGGSSGATLTDAVKRNVAAAIWNGNYGWGNGTERANKLKEVFGANNGIQDLVNQGVGKNSKAPDKDYTYLNMRKKFKGYYAGTRYATPGWHAIDERGGETTFESADGTRYKLFTGGEKVLNAQASNFLYDFAVGGRKIFAGIFRDLIDPRRGIIQPPVRRYEINAGDIIVQGNADKATVSEIRRARRESMDMILKELGRLST